MNNAKHTRRALLSSVVALVLCLTMLMGTTFAWFTDTAKVNVNTITSGTLTLKLTDDKGNDVENGMLYFVDKNGEAITDAYYWEPGCTYNLQTLTVENTGSLALKFKVVVTGINGDSMLNEVIDWTIKCAGETYAEGKEISLAPNGKTTFTVSGHMDEEANNNYQDKKIEGISITVYATQDTVEYDSESNEYDANATYDLLSNEKKASSDEELAAILANLDGVDTIYLGKGTFSAFNIGTATFNLVGAVNADGSPATKIVQDTSFTTENHQNDKKGFWYNYSGVVENVVFEANDGIANNSFANYDALYVQYGDVTFENCHFVNQGVHFTTDVDFVDCVFDGKNHAEKALRYCVVLSGATGTLANCVIKNYTDCGINVAESAGSLTIDGCELTNCQADGEFGIHIGQINGLTIKDSTLNCDVKYYSSLTGSFSESGNTFGNGYSVKAE